jgi:rhamnosyltransferase subunit B
LFAVGGSAGDVFPSLAVAQKLDETGHDTTFLAPPASGLYSRQAGFRTLLIGRTRPTTALAATNDISTRFDGLASWRSVAVHGVYPLLANGNYERARDLVAQSQPDLVVTHPLAYFGSLIASELGIPWVTLHLYPQLAARAKNARRSSFGGVLAHEIHRIESAADISPSANPLLQWGWANINLSVHDPAVVQNTELSKVNIGEPHGFPYWDRLPGNAVDLSRVNDTLGCGEPPAVVTLGSFMGHGRHRELVQIVKALRRLRMPVLLVGPLVQTWDDLEGVTCTGFIPLSLIARHARILVHHGGLGTTYAGLHAGIPAVTVPHAFDQAFNGRLIEQLGVGAILRPHEKIETVVAMLDQDGEARGRANQLAKQLRRPQEAVDSIVSRLTSELDNAA